MEPINVKENLDDALVIVRTRVHGSHAIASTTRSGYLIDPNNEAFCWRDPFPNIPSSVPGIWFISKDQFENLDLERLEVVFIPVAEIVEVRFTHDARDIRSVEALRESLILAERDKAQAR